MTDLSSSKVAVADMWTNRSDEGLFGELSTSIDLKQVTERDDHLAHPQCQILNNRLIFASKLERRIAPG